MEQLLKESLEKHKQAIQQKYQMGGLSDGLYGDYASDVTKAVVLELLQAEIGRLEGEKLKEIKLSQATYDKYGEESTKEMEERELESYNQALQDQINHLEEEIKE